MADKETKLSIVIRTVDKATAAVRAFKERIGKTFDGLKGRIGKAFAPLGKALDGVRERMANAFAPVKMLGASLKNLGAELGIGKLFAGLKGLGGVAKSGVGKLFDAFKAVGGAVGGIISKIPILGAVLVGTAGAAVAGLVSLVGEFDELGDKSEALGVSADFLAQMRYAAERSGASVEELDGGLKSLSQSLGQARAGTGRMAAFLTKVSPALLRQMKATKSNEEAFDLLAGAMDKIEDPAKRAALAQKLLGDSALAPLLARGRDGIKQLRDEFYGFNGSLQDAVDKAGGADDEMVKLKASTTGLKAALVSGLAPALTIVVGRMREWLVGHRADIAKWATQLGEKLPGAIAKIVSGIETAIDKMKTFFSAVADLVEKADLFFNGPKELEGMTPEEFMQGKQSEVRLRNQLKGTQQLSARAKLARSQQLLAEAAALDSGPDQHSQRDEHVAEAKREAARLLREQVGPDAARLLREMQARPFAAADMGAAAREALGAARSSATEAKVTIDIKNAPTGTRVSTDPRSTTDVDLSVGYQLLPGIL